jgi:DNA replication protein DnaC
MKRPGRRGVAKRAPEPAAPPASAPPAADDALAAFKQRYGADDDDEDGMATLRRLADAQRAAFEAENAAARIAGRAGPGDAPERVTPPIGRARRAPVLVRPRWCALGCGARLVDALTYCEACQPRAARERRVAYLADAIGSLPKVPQWARLGDPAFAAYVGAQNAALISAARAGFARGTLPRLFLSGPPDAGKTSAAVAILRALLDDARDADDEASLFAARGIRFAPAYAIAVVRQDNKLGQEPKELGEWFRAPLLVIDDIGSETATPSSPMLELVYRRFDDGLPTITTTGFNEQSIDDRYGVGIVKRLTAGGLVIAMQPPAKR